MTDWKEIWKQRKSASQPKDTDHERIGQHVAAHKRRKLEAKATTLPPTATIGRPSCPTSTLQRQQQVEQALVKSGFFDEPDGEEDGAPPAAPDTTHPTDRSPSVIVAQRVESVQAPQRPAGQMMRMGPQLVAVKEGAATSLPEGFFDNRLQDAKARNVLQEYNQKLAEDERTAQQKKVEEVEAQYEAGQRAAASWTMVRELDELQGMAAAQERLEAIRVRLETHRTSRNSGSTAVPVQGTHTTSSDDSEDDVDTVLAMYDWRQKVSRKQGIAAPFSTHPPTTAVGNSQGGEGADSGDDMGAP
eukprot:GGOE01042816.1.p1 GENE.GGOE01042816.1~~GGOE01042816.1.p1  ORF type:complete len:302 (-),score=76.56 GGOE01042816.1:127-1032(-)